MRSVSTETTSEKKSFIEAARRSQIVEATIDAIAEQGYAQASLAQIASKAGIAKSIVLYHFKNKDELLEVTLEHLYDGIRSFVEPRIIAAESATEKMKVYIEAEFAYLEEHRRELLAVSYILRNHRDAGGRLAFKEDAERIVLAMLGGLLEAGQAAGEFRRFSVPVMAITLNSAINGALDRSVDDPTLSLTDYARELTSLFTLATRAESPSSLP